MIFISNEHSRVDECKFNGRLVRPSQTTSFSTKALLLGHHFKHSIVFLLPLELDHFGLALGLHHSPLTLKFNPFGWALRLPRFGFSTKAPPLWLSTRASAVVSFLGLLCLSFFTGYAPLVFQSAVYHWVSINWAVHKRFSPKSTRTLNLTEHSGILSRTRLHQYQYYAATFLLSLSQRTDSAKAQGDFPLWTKLDYSIKLSLRFSFTNTSVNLHIHSQNDVQTRAVSKKYTEALKLVACSISIHSFIHLSLLCAADPGISFTAI